MALRVNHSRLEATCVHVEADTAILATGSTLDLAGVEVIGRQAAIRTDLAARVLFSVSRIQSSYNNGYVHGIMEVTKDHPL